MAEYLGEYKIIRRMDGGGNANVFTAENAKGEEVAIRSYFIGKERADSNDKARVNLVHGRVGGISQRGKQDESNLGKRKVYQ